MHKITRSFVWSPDGCHIARIEAGEHDELPERAVQIAEQLGFLGVDNKPVVSQDPPEPEPEPEPEPVPTKKKK